MPAPNEQKRNETLRYTQRLLAWSAYQESLRDTDQKILQQFQATISSLRVALWIKALTYILQIVIVGAAFFISNRQVMQSNVGLNWPGLISLVSLGLFGFLLYRNPVQSINRTLVDLARVQVILQGYQRQINQVDAAFKQALLENELDPENFGKSLDQIQRVIDANVESLLQFLEEMSA